MERQPAYNQALDEFVEESGVDWAEHLAVLSQGYFGRLVSLERTFRDGQKKYEVLPERLAELALAMIPFEPQAQDVASAKILYSEAEELTEDLRQAYIKAAEAKVKDMLRRIKAMKNGAQPSGSSIAKKFVQ